LAVLDNLKGKIYLIVYADPAQANAYKNAKAELEGLRARLRAPVALPLSHASAKTPVERVFPKADFLQAVDAVTGADFIDGAPNFTPETKGQIVIDRLVNPPVLYVSKDKTSPSDWVQFRPAPTAVKKKFTLTSQDITNGYIVLTSTEIIRASVTAYLDRILLFEGADEDYEIFFAPNGDVRLIFSPGLRDFDYVGEVFRISYWTP
jgi:hypothetical protein